VFLSCAGTDLFVAQMCEKLIKQSSKGRIETFLYDKSIEGGQVIPMKCEAVSDAATSF
jgi:hypothetical protein